MRINVLDVAILSMSHSQTMGSSEERRAIHAAIDADFPLHVCTTPKELFDLFGTGKRPMVVLDVSRSDEADGFMLGQFLQSAFHCGIVLYVNDTPEDRIRGWSCGADICLSGPIVSAELIAALNALHRRLGTDGASATALPTTSAAVLTPPGAAALPQTINALAGAPEAFDPSEGFTAARPARSSSLALRKAAPLSERAWVLEDRGWRLRAPDGNAVDLSSGERSFMVHLFRSPSRLLRRDHWDYVLPSTAVGERTRRIDVMVSRLRRKVNQVSKTFPLHVCRGVGYHFSESCIIEGDPAIEAGSR
jgi:two-component system OmpR family response regulator